jgi:tetratricopeptide (TPR) repeat protein
MPVRTYMVIDPRHDHSFRIPRPDVSARLQTPNACNDCHADKAPEWAAAAIERWHGPTRKGFQNHAAAFHAAWGDEAGAARLLAAVAADTNASGFARAGALGELRSHPSPAIPTLARAGLADSDTMVRIAAIDMLESMPAAQVWPVVAPLLSDPNRGVRIRAASLLAAVPAARQPPADRERFERAAAEFVGVQRLNADRPEARSALGNFLARRGQPVEAEAEFKAALRLSADYAPAAINLADLYRQLGRDDESESVLRAGLAGSPRDGGLHHALGLTLVRLKRTDESLVALRSAAELEPARARYTYVYAVALHSAGRAADAIAALQQNLTRHPGDRDTLLGLVSFHREAGDAAAALTYAERLAAIVPDDQAVARLVIELRRQTQQPKAQ